jgi:hypothetical protein
MTMTSDPTAEGVVALTLRRPGWAFGLAGLAVAYAVGLGFATAAAMLLQGAPWQIAEALAIPASAATALTAVELGRPLRRAHIKHWKHIALRGARAWGAIGAAWPLAWAVGFALDGAPGDLGAEALRVLAGLFIGGLAGGLAATVAGAAVVVRAWPKAAID